jgi:hypothetical protein
MIQLGDIYRIKMYRSDGIAPKGEDVYRNKYIIIIGHDKNDFFGAVVTNTHDHHLVPIEFQYPLKLQGYNCYVNCFQLHQVSSKRLLQDCYKGKITDEDFEMIVGCIKTSPLIQEKLLKRF